MTKPNVLIGIPGGEDRMGKKDTNSDLLNCETKQKANANNIISKHFVKLFKLQGEK